MPELMVEVVIEPWSFWDDANIEKVNSLLVLPYR